MAKLGLGTVQLGLPYGAAAEKPLISEQEAFAILKCALEHGIRFFDTARSYGESEHRLGVYGLGAQAPEVEVCTKIPSVDRELFQNTDKYLGFLNETLRLSTNNLRCSRLGLLQFHQCEEDFLASKTFETACAFLLENKLCTSIGVSVYKPSQALLALANQTISSLQVPINLLDDRFTSRNLIKLYQEKKVRILARSIFLQGILVPSVKLPNVKKKKELAHLRALISKEIPDFHLQTEALRYVFKNCSSLIDIALIGCNAVSDLRMNLDLVNKLNQDDRLFSTNQITEAREFASELNLFDPSTWNK